MNASAFVRVLSPEADPHRDTTSARGLIGHLSKNRHFFSDDSNQTSRSSSSKSRLNADPLTENPVSTRFRVLPVTRDRRPISAAPGSMIGDNLADTALFHRGGMMQSFAALINPPWRNRFRILSSGHSWSPSSRNDADSPGRNVRRFRSTVAFGSTRATST